jgi:hypothetical protein
MSQKIIIRTFIVLFGLIAISVVGALIVVGDGNPTQELHAAAAEFHSTPTEDRLRRLLNVESDGGYSYLKMALVGRAFAEQPAVFRSVADSPATPLEQRCLYHLGRLGTRVFEYHEALKPAGFDAVLQSSTWLKTEAQQGSGAGQPASQTASDSEGGEKLQPEPEGASR